MLVLALVTLVLFGILWYLHNKLTYWQRKGVPTPGLIYQWHYYRRELGPYDEELKKRHGSVYGVLEGLKPNLIVSDPDLIRDILVKDFSSFPNHKPFRIGAPIVDLNMFSLDGNEDWKRIRSLVSPTFTSGKLRSMDSLVNSCIDALKKNLEVVAKTGESIDAKKYFNSLSFDVVVRCAYGAHMESLNDPENPMQKNFEDLFSTRWEMFFSLFFPRIAKWTGVQKLALKPTDFFVQMTEKLIHDRNQVASMSGNKRIYNDFLQVLLEANQEASKLQETEAQGQCKKTMSTEEMMAQCMIFLVAGFDTTASILACAAYHLAKTPSVQDKLRQEVSTLSDFTHDTVMNLKYLDAVLKESFRLSPPIMRVERECISPTVLGDVRVEPGTIVTIPVYVVHRDPNQYRNPEKFDPNRFMEENDSFHPYSYLPFGGGPRICVAQRFALMEAKLALAKILVEFSFEATPETKVIDLTEMVYKLRFGINTLYKNIEFHV